MNSDDLLFADTVSVSLERATSQLPGEGTAQDEEAWPQTPYQHFPADVVSPEMKYASRLAQVRYRMSANPKITLRTSHCARDMRRDFNIATAKMYVFALDHKYKREITNAISDLRHELTMLAATCMPYRHFEIINLQPIKYNVLVISPESAAMVRSLTKADLLFACLYEAEFRKVITREQRFQIMLPFMMVYSHFKKVAMKIQSASVDEMVNGIDIES